MRYKEMNKIVTGAQTFNIDFVFLYDSIYSTE